MIWKVMYIYNLFHLPKLIITETYKIKTKKYFHPIKYKMATEKLVKLIVFKQNRSYYLQLISSVRCPDLDNQL